MQTLTAQSAVTGTFTNPQLSNAATKQFLEGYSALLSVGCVLLQGHQAAASAQQPAVSSAPRRPAGSWCQHI